MNPNIKQKFFSYFVLLILTLSMLYPSSVALADDTPPPPQETQEPTPPPEETEEPVSPPEETQEPVAPQEDPAPTLEVFPIETLIDEDLPELEVYPTETPLAGELPELQEFPIEDPVEAEGEPEPDAPDEGEDTEEVSLAEVVAEAEELDIMLADNSGEPLELGSIEAAETLSAGDPYFVRDDITYYFMPIGGCGVLPNCTESPTPIQAALNDVATNGIPDEEVAPDGELRRTIYVESGIYAEQISINTANLTLWGDPGILDLPGAGPDAPILDGASLLGLTTGVTINAEGVSLIGFIIQNYDLAIYQPVISGSNTVTIENNTIQNNVDGFKVVKDTGSPGTEVHYNSFQNNSGYDLINGEPDSNNTQFVNAQNNYWGCVGGPIVPFKDPKNSGDWDYVDWATKIIYEDNPNADCAQLYGSDADYNQGLPGGATYVPYRIRIGNLAIPGCEDPEANNYGQPGVCTYDPEPYCGDNIVNQTSEQCDGTDGVGKNQSCSESCTLIQLPYCGDGTVDEGETCDDGNTVNGDGCSADCTVETPAPYCGDGTVDEGEACDDGNTVNGDGCSADCTIETVQPYCGDGTIDEGEACDDGNTVNGDGCSADCTVETVQAYCGDGNLDPGEECDDGNLSVYDGCSAICTVEVPVCGNGYLEQGEACDDGNNVGGDGCSATCAVEIPGCTNPLATNYNPNATVDDGSCVYPPVLGCTDPFALNYSSSAIIDDGSCRYPLTPPEPPVLVSSFIPVTGGEVHAIAAGIAHTCAITPEGGVQCWGNNDYGQLGNGTYTSSNFRVDVTGLLGATTIVAGGNHTCVLSGSDVWCWGQNSSGQLGDGTTADRNVPVKVLSGVVDITAGYDFTCATLLNGQAMCWGNNDKGQVANDGQAVYPSPTLAKLMSGLSQIDAGRNKNCGLTPAGLVRCVSGSTSEELGDPSATNLNVAVNRFGPSVIALNDQGVPIQFLYGEPRMVNQLSAVQDIDSGFGHICALQSTGSVECWGANNYGQLGNNSKDRSADPVAVQNLYSAWQLAVGRNHTCVMTITNDPGDPGIQCWGLNTDGQLGDGTNETSLVPVKVK